MPRVVVIDGIIGAGKTTAVNLLESELTSRGLRVVVVPEPVDNWVEIGILGSFYSDMKRWSYGFQTYAFCSRVMLIQDTMLKHGDDTDVFILERFPATDRAFVEGLLSSGDMTDMEYAMYSAWADMWGKLITLPVDRIIHLNTPIPVCMERIQSRGRRSEELITAQYQELLLEKYSEVLTTAGIDVVVVSELLDTESSSCRSEFASLVMDGLL